MQLLLVVDRLLLVLPERVVDRQDAREGGARRARVGRLDLALEGGIEQIVPRRGRLEALFLEELRVRHEDERVLAHGGVVPVLVLQLRRDLVDVGRLVRLDDPRLLRGREAVAGRAPDDVGARIVLLRGGAGDQLTRGQPEEVDLHARPKLPSTS